MNIAVFGFHPQLSYAELLRTHHGVTRHGTTTAKFRGEVNPHLGGCLKIGEVVDELPTTRARDIEEHLRAHIHAYLPAKEQKMSFGISVVDGRVNNYRQLCFDLKKILRQNGTKPRVVLGQNQFLNAARVHHNHLDRDPNAEIVVCFGPQSTIIARTVWIQNVDAYSKRDIDRPCRDMATGMLPPKLAQIMINLAGGTYVHDPFCGSGVILQEALLMHKRAGGSDLETDMVNCTYRNLAWLRSEFDTPPPETIIEADAREVVLDEGVDAIVSEGYLGPIMHRRADETSAKKLARESDELLRASLDNFKIQLNSGNTVCLAAPAWRQADTFIMPDIVDDPSPDGYNQLRLDGVAPRDLLYARDKQYVGRKLMLLERD